LPHPDAIARELPTDGALARRLGLGAREEKPTSADVVHLEERLAILEARTARGGAYLVLLDRPVAEWEVVGSVLAAPSGVTRVRSIHAIAPDSIDVAVEGTESGVWHLATDPPRPGLRQVLVGGAGDVTVDDTGPWPRPVTVGERRYTGGPDGYRVAE
jgi:hypothetical protein